MQKDLQTILNEYSNASTETYSNHAIGNILRSKIPNIIRQSINNPERYIVKGSAGVGQWTSIPWIAIFDILVTETAQSGYYPVYLFKDDMSGIYFSLNQGVTEIKNKYKRETKQVLKLKAEDYRYLIGDKPKSFNLTEILLRNKSSTNSNLGELYEAGNIYAKYYKRDNIPSDKQLLSDILEMLEIYSTLANYDNTSPNKAKHELDDFPYLGIENLKKISMHKRIERNSKLSRKVKEIQGYTCKACGMNFESTYGDLGKGFIEAHHLRPISSLVGDKIELNAQTDFIVLCSNCHRMIHRLEDPSDLSLLKMCIKNV